MAKYFESSTDFSNKTLNSPVDLLRLVVASIFLSPIRLIFEVSRKCLFLGEYFNKFILNAIYFNLALLVLSLGNSIFVTKRIYVKGTFMPITSLVISAIGLSVIYYFGTRNNLEVNFELKDSIDDVVSKLENVYGVESDSNDSSDPSNDGNQDNQDGKPNNLSLIERINSSKESPSIGDEEELEITTDDDFDNVYSSEVNKAMEKVPKENVSDLQARLDNLKSTMKEKTMLHNKEVSLLNGLKSTMDDLENKTNIIKERYSGGDDDFGEKVRMVDLIRKGKSIGEEIIENGGSFDDDPSAPEDVNSYSKKITERSNKRRQSLSSLMNSSNSSSMIDVPYDEPSTNGDDTMTTDFIHNLNLANNDSLDSDNVDDMSSYDPNGIDFMGVYGSNDPMSMYTGGGLGFDDIGVGIDMGDF